MEIFSKRDALLLGLKRYFTGVPCKHGHICERMVRNNECVECRNYAKRGYRERLPPPVKKEGTYYERNRKKLLSKGQSQRDAAKLRGLALGIDRLLSGDPPKRLGYDPRLSRLVESGKSIDLFLSIEQPKRLGLSRTIAGRHVISCADAAMLGMARYFTGSPCVNGHVCEKYVSNHNCVKCRGARARMKRKFQSEEEKAHKRVLSRESWRRMNRDSRIAFQWRRLENEMYPELVTHRNRVYRLYYYHFASDTQIKRRKDRYKKRYARSGLRYARGYRDRQRGLVNAHHAMRRCTKANASPPWLTREQKKEIVSIYKWCKLETELTGVKHHVDHIYPLKHKHMCGLHVPWNLQVIPAKENLVKHNSLPS